MNLSKEEQEDIRSIVLKETGQSYTKSLNIEMPVLTLGTSSSRKEKNKFYKNFVLHLCKEDGYILLIPNCMWPEKWKSEFDLDDLHNPQ